MTGSKIIRPTNALCNNSTHREATSNIRRPKHIILQPEWAVKGIIIFPHHGSLVYLHAGQMRHAMPCHAMLHNTFFHTRPLYREHYLYFYSPPRIAKATAITVPATPTCASFPVAPAVTTGSVVEEGFAEPPLPAPEDPAAVPLAIGDTTVCEYVCPSDVKVLVNVVCA